DETTIIPSLAESWSESKDAATYTFKLYGNATWSDGRPVTTNDVIFTIAWTAQNPDAFKGYGVTGWLSVKGAAGVKGTTRVPSGLKKLDDHTIAITLEQPDSTFLRAIAGAVYAI